MKETTAINTVYEIGTDRFFGPIRVEKTSGNETSVVLSIDPEELIIMNREEFSQVCEAVKKLMGWELEERATLDTLLEKADIDDPTISIDVHLWKDEDQTEIFIKKIWLEDDTVSLIWRDADRATKAKLAGVALPPETPTKLVLVYGEVCNSGKAGTVAQSEMNSEEFADCEGDEDRLTDAFGDCLVLDQEGAQAMADSTANGGHGTFNRKAGKNALDALEYFDATN